MRNLISMVTLGILTGCTTPEDRGSYFPPISNPTYQESQKPARTNLPPQLLPGEKFDLAKILIVTNHPGDPKFRYTDIPELKATLELQEKVPESKPEKSYQEYSADIDPDAPVPIR